MRSRTVLVVVAAMLSAPGVWAAPPQCPGIQGDAVPLTGTAIACSQSDCSGSIGSALADIAVDFCNLGILPVECGRCECCRRPQADLFTGTDVAFTGGNPQNFCGIGGRGRPMGEAALCLLRDLAEPALGSPGAGIRLARSGSLGIGDLEVRQHVGFVDFDPVLRRMHGYHAVSVCAPALGCLNDLTQSFTATLRQVHGGSGECGDYRILDPSWVLRVDSEQLEQNVGVKVGPVSITPSFGYEVNLEAVTSPWASGGGRRTQPLCLALDEYNVTSADGGVLSSVIAGAGTGANGWNAALGLGARDPDPEGAIWAAPGSFPLRPDPDFSIARSALEKRPTARFLTTARVSYGVGDLAVSLNYPPLSLVAFEVYVESKLDAAVVSQFALVLDEGKAPFVPPDCTASRSYTSVQVQSALDALAQIGIKAGVRIEFALELLFKTIHFRFNPEVTLAQPDVVAEQLVTSPLAQAAINYGTPPPAGPASYDAFASFSGGSEDGRAFVDACHQQPPPPPQQLPTPSAEPGDPDDIVKPNQFPCNICLYFPGTVSEICAPKADVPDDYFCPPAINGMPCTDPNCENVAVSPPQAVNLKQVVFPVSQSGLPSGKQWMCNAFEKFGCFDLCAYDPNSSAPLTITQSAVDTIGARCRDATGGGDPPKNGLPCQGDSICDDGNPCTEDRCVGTGEFGTCQITPSSGPCDDGLFCTGTDSCALGICGQHGGNPCTASQNCCDEASDSCPASCPGSPCEGKQAGVACDDGTACTTGDVCVATAAGLLCRGTAALSCPAGPCVAGVCEDVQGLAQCAEVPSGACPAECGDGQLDPGEDCDGAVDGACPGQCGSDCYCPPPERDTGDPCTSPPQCASGFCVDGVCCGSACDGDAEQCNLPGQVGVCGSLAAPVPALSLAALAVALLALIGISARRWQRR